MRKIRNKICLAFFLIPLLVQAQINKKGVEVSSASNDHGRIFGIVIGISNYAQLNKLQFADKDAIYFYNYLCNLNGSDSNLITLFTNDNATRDAITDKLYSITDEVKPGDKVYIYFSGHGDMEQKVQTDNCLLLLSNSPAKNYLRKSNFYLDINLFREFYQSWAKKNVKTIFVCDACHSGSLIGGEEGRKNTILSLQQSWGNEIKLFSCQAGEVSLEGKQWGNGRGLFSFYFVLGLKGLADRDKNQEVNLIELDSYLKEKVSVSSDQLQIPLAQGDLRAVLGTVSPKSLAEAGKEILNKNDLANSLAVRSVNTDLSELIKDSLDRATYLLFKQRLKKAQLIEPDNYCAYYYFKLLESRHFNKLLLNTIRLELINALQQSYDQLLDYVYDDKYDAYGINEKTILERQLKTSLELAGNNIDMANKIKSKIFFVQACEISDDIMQLSSNPEDRRKMEEGIVLLKKAIQFDPMSPNLYLRSGDYYLYSQKPTEAIKAYQMYQQLLPNDEYSYNKLGLAYMAVKQTNLAAESFKKAIRINPEFYKAIENLKVLTGK